jgi:hypothetical protein
MPPARYHIVMASLLLLVMFFLSFHGLDLSVNALKWSYDYHVGLFDRVDCGPVFCMSYTDLYVRSVVLMIVCFVTAIGLLTFVALGGSWHHNNDVRGSVPSAVGGGVHA